MQQRITYWLCSGIDLESGSFMTCPRASVRGIRDLPRALTQGQAHEGGGQGSYLAVEDAGLCPRHAGLHPPQVAVDDVLRRCDAGVFHSRASLAGPKLAKIDCFLSGGVEGGRDMKMGMRFRVRHACILSLPAGTRCLSDLMAPRKCASARTISLVPVLACLHAQDSHGTLTKQNFLFSFPLFCVSSMSGSSRVSTAGFPLGAARRETSMC